MQKYELRSWESRKWHSANAISELYHDFEDKNFVQEVADESDDSNAIKDILKTVSEDCEIKAEEIIKNKQGKCDWLYKDDGSVNQDSYFWKSFICKEVSKSGDRKFIRPEDPWKKINNMCFSSSLYRLQRVPKGLKEIADSKAENKNFIKRYLILLYIWGGIRETRIPIYEKKQEWAGAFDSQRRSGANGSICNTVFEDDYNFKKHTLKFSFCNLILPRLFDPSYMCESCGRIRGHPDFLISEKQLEVLKNADDDNYRESTIFDVLRKIALVIFILTVIVIIKKFIEKPSKDGVQ